jgi:Amt family ammonium transporter
LNLKDVVGSTLWLEQLKAIGVTLVLSIGATAMLGYLLKATVGLRPSAEDEQSGLDITGHGERGYHPSEV